MAPSRRSMLKSALGLTALPALGGCVSSPEPQSGPSAAEVDFIESQMAEYKVPGVAVAKVEDAAVAWEAEFGYANLETREAVSKQSLFQAASLTKPLFAYVVMQAVEQELIALDAKLVDYATPPGLVKSEWAAQVNVKDVLQHTAGLPNWRESEENAVLEVAYEPGTQSSYSGEAYCWLQRVMDVVTGEGLDSYASRLLLQPAGLRNMALSWRPEHDNREVYGHSVGESGQAVLHDVQVDRELGYALARVAKAWGKPLQQWTMQEYESAVRQMRPPAHERMRSEPNSRWAEPNYHLLNSAGSLRSTAGDFARFMCLMMPNRQRASWEVTEATRAFMVAPQFERPTVQNGALPRGIGWGLEKRPNGIAIYHWGNNYGRHRAIAVGDLVSRSGIVIMCNGSNGKPLIKDLVAGLTGKTYISVTTS